MMYQCPICGRYGMEWDGRAKVLLCHYNTCNHVIRIENQKKIPDSETILEVIKDDLNFINKIQVNKLDRFDILDL